VGYLLIIGEPELILADAESRDLRVFLELLADACFAWCQKAIEGENEFGATWTHGTLPFHTLLVSADPQSLLTEWGLGTRTVPIAQ
jgi:hypothetical protein